MTSISAAKLLFTRFENYIAGAFHPIPEEQVVAGIIQSFYGWVFPLLRNAFICGVLQYLADASGSMTLQILAIIAYGVLVAYCFSYIIAGDRKSTRLNSSHLGISYAVFCLKKKNN